MYFVLSKYGIDTRWMHFVFTYLIRPVGKSLELEQPQYFVDGRGTLQAKKGRKNFFGCSVRKMGYSIFGEKVLGEIRHKNRAVSSAIGSCLVFYMRQDTN